ncbi:MAG: hypothetical protein Q9169_000749 [Polycauliona sp. 2 TL-2023]
MKNEEIAKSVPYQKLLHSVDTKPIKRQEGTPRIVISDVPCSSVKNSRPHLLEDDVDSSTLESALPGRLSCKDSVREEKHNSQVALALSTLTLQLNTDLKADTTTCVAKTRKGTRCTYRIGKLAIKEARKILEQLEKKTISQDWKPPLDQVQLLASLLHCKKQHQDVAHTLTKQWATAIDPTQVSLVQAEVCTPSHKHDYTAACIRNLIQYDTTAKSIANTTKFIEGALRRQLTRREVKIEGYMYIYNFPGNFGHVKIGVTSRMLEERLREWQNQCGHVPELLFPKTEEDLVPIPHVYRVESIVHAQLRDCRKKELRCRKCQKCHVEWFESSVPEAIEAVKRWSKWIREKPYKESSNGIWALAESQKDAIGALCQSIEENRQDQERSRRQSTFSPSCTPQTIDPQFPTQPQMPTHRPSRPRSPLAGPSTGPATPFPITLSGPIVKGFGRGSRELGIPTANIPLAGLSVGGHQEVESGVYYGWAGVDVDAQGMRIQGDGEAKGGVWPMVMSIGWNPFYKNTVRSVEVHIMHGFQHDFYGARMNLLILGFVRPEYDYVDKESLVEDIRTDIEVARRSLEREAYARSRDDPYLIQFEGGEHDQEVAS